MKYTIIKILILILFILLILTSRSYALGDWIQQAETFIEDGGKEAGVDDGKGSTFNTKKLAEGSTKLYNAFLSVGTVVVAAVGAIMGIQFMTAGIDKKVEIKQSLYPYLISCIVLFGSYGIWRLVIIIMNEVQK